MVPGKLNRLGLVTPKYFDTDSTIGGGERYPLNVARAVVRATGGQSEVRIISFGSESKEVALGDGVSLCVLSPAYRPDHEINPVAWGLVDHLADVDVVHAQQVFTRPGEASVLIASILGKPVFGTDLGSWASTLGMRFGMLELTNSVICISDFAAALLPTSTRLEVIRGGVDTDVFTPPGSPAARDYVLFVGRLLPHKGIDNLIGALPGDMRLVVCGTPYDDAYHTYLLSLAEGKRVDFVTTATDANLLELYQHALATVLPSVYRDYAGNFQRAPELMGLTLIESMACGTPAICSRVGGMPELIRHGETGFIFDSVHDLGDILTQLGDGRLSAGEVGNAGRRAAVAEYSFDRVGSRLVELYEEALARN